MTAATPYWWKAISDAHDRGAFTEADRATAADWTTCACGNQDPRIPRRPEDDTEGFRGEPIDENLAFLGCRFYWAVDDDNIALAEKLLHAIERRSEQILAEVGA